MPPEKDWRAPSDEAGDDALQYCDIAMGYLSRNTRYRADYTLTSLIHDARFRVRSGHLLRLAVLRGRPASLA
ncbi:hypothetical protein FHS51_002802, partial [Sphingobium wenxiniae]